MIKVSVYHCQEDEFGSFCHVLKRSFFLTLETDFECSLVYTSFDCSKFFLCHLSLTRVFFS